MIPDTCQHLQELGHYYVEKCFVPALTDGHISNSIEMKLLSLPVKPGGMRIVTFADMAKTEYQNLRNMTKSSAKIGKENCSIMQKGFLQSLVINLSTNKICLNEIS